MYLAEYICARVARFLFEGGGWTLRAAQRSGTRKGRSGRDHREFRATAGADADSCKSATNRIHEIYRQAFSFVSTLFPLACDREDPVVPETVLRSAALPARVRANSARSRLRRSLATPRPPRSLLRADSRSTRYFGRTSPL